jgi:predicted DNA-binding helix-hairpin-helix protein
VNYDRIRKLASIIVDYCEDQYHTVKYDGRCRVCDVLIEHECVYCCNTCWETYFESGISLIGWDPSTDSLINFYRSFRNLSDEEIRLKLMLGSLR